MAEFKYPGSDLDNANRLLGLLGSFWSETYQGNELLKSLTHTRAQLDKQTHLDLLELVASVSRFDVPVFHREHWTLLTLRKSETNNFEALLPKYSNDPTHVYDGTLHYGEVPVSTLFSFPVNPKLVDCKIVMNRITEPSVSMVKGLDFWLPEPGVITFRSDPFSDPLIPRRQILEDGVVVDEECGLWLFHGDWDWDHIYRQFGYTLKMKLQSSEGYKELLNAILDALTEGTKVRDMHFAWSAITGIPLTIEAQETVEVIDRDIRHEVVITDQHAYKFPLGSTVIVEVGDVVYAGDPLVDTLQFFEFNRGQVPDELQALTMGPGFLATGFYSDLTFENKDVDLVVEEDVDGFTKVSFELGGFPADVTEFFDRMHASGVERNQTLAHLLDVRGDNRPEGIEPTAASLPATINPMAFLCQNLLRFHAYVVRVRTSLMSRKKLGLAAAVNLAKIVPPHTAMIVVVELEHQDEPIIMDGPGDESAPGYEEAVSGFPMMVAADILDPSFIQERVRIYQIAGKCE